MTRGVVLYRGPSLLDGGPIVAIASFRSSNSKTGDIPQVWILRRDVAPGAAVQSGAERSICGSCPLRGGTIDGRAIGRSCYVVVHHGPTAVWMGYRRGIYRDATPGTLARLFTGMFVRVGAYGDPAAVPSHVWRGILARARGWTAYTHQWRVASLQWLAMASCESDADTRDAVALGYRVFRVTPPNTPRLPGHLPCPASAEQGRRATCMECGACNGGRSARGPHVQIEVHGMRRNHALPLLARGEGGQACAH